MRKNPALVLSSIPMFIHGHYHSGTLNKWWFFVIYELASEAEKILLANGRLQNCVFVIYALACDVGQILSTRDGKMARF